MKTELSNKQGEPKVRSSGMVRPLSSTPETDQQKWINRYPEYHEGAQRWVKMEHAQRLEVERDEARKLAAELRDWQDEQLRKLGGGWTADQLPWEV